MHDGFPERLKRLRLRKKMKRKILADLCGLHPRSIRDYEEGETEPKLNSLIAICEVLGCSMHELTGK